MIQKIDNNILAKFMEEAMKVDFLNSSWEIKLWAYSLYNAEMWGKKIK